MRIIKRSTPAPSIRDRIAGRKHLQNRPPIRRYPTKRIRPTRNTPMQIVSEAYDLVQSWGSDPLEDGIALYEAILEVANSYNMDGYAVIDQWRELGYLGDDGLDSVSAPLTPAGAFTIGRSKPRTQLVKPTGNRYRGQRSNPAKTIRNNSITESLRRYVDNDYAIYTAVQSIVADGGDQLAVEDYLKEVIESAVKDAVQNADNIVMDLLYSALGEIHYPTLAQQLLS